MVRASIVTRTVSNKVVQGRITCTAYRPLVSTTMEGPVAPVLHRYCAAWNGCCHTAWRVMEAAPHSMVSVSAIGSRGAGAG